MSGDPTHLQGEPPHRAAGSLPTPAALPLPLFSLPSQVQSLLPIQAAAEGRPCSPWPLLGQTMEATLDLRPAEPLPPTQTAGPSGLVPLAPHLSPSSTPALRAAPAARSSGNEAPLPGGSGRSARGWASAAGRARPDPASHSAAPPTSRPGSHTRPSPRCPGSLSYPIPPRGSRREKSYRGSAPLPGRPAAHGGAGSNLGRNGSGAEATAPRGPVPAAASLPAPPADLIAESGLIGNANGN